MSSLAQGSVVLASDPDFQNRLTEVVDYRGDHSIYLKDATKVEGYVFNLTVQTLDLLPPVGLAVSISLQDIERIEFSGSNPADGKSWEDWMNKKHPERQAIKAAPLEAETLEALG